MATVFTLKEAESSLRELVDRAASGEEVIITESGHPRVRLVATSPARRSPGGWEGQVKIHESFDAPLPKDLLDAFEGSS